MSYRLKRGRSRLSQLNDICCHISNSRCQSRLSLSGMRWKHPIITTFPLASAQVVLHWRGAVLVGEENSAKKSPRKETLIPGGSVESVSFSRANLNFSARNKLGASKQHTYHTRQKIICNIFFTQHPNHQQVNQTVQRNFKRTERREHHSQRSGRSVCPATRQFLRHRRVIISSGCSNALQTTQSIYHIQINLQVVCSICERSTRKSRVVLGCSRSCNKKHGGNFLSLQVYAISVRCRHECRKS